MTTTINANVTANVAPVATVSVEKKEEIKMTREMIREALRKNGIEMSNKEFKATKKDQLMEMLLDVEQSNGLEEKEEETMVVEEKNDVTVVVEDKWNKLMKAVSLKAMLQTVPHDKDNKPVINIGKDGKVVLLNYSLFYRATERTDVKDLMVVGKRLWGVVGKVIEEVYGKNHTTSENIQKTIDKMIELNLIHKVVENRTYVTVSATGLPETTKNTFNNLYSSKDIKVEKEKDGRVKVIAVTDNGRKAINTLYPNFSYRASARELTNMYNLSR